MGSYAKGNVTTAAMDAAIAAAIAAQQAANPRRWSHSFFAPNLSVATSPFFVFGHATSAIGLILPSARVVDRIQLTFSCTAGVGPPTLTLTLRKNANSGDASRILVLETGEFANGNGYSFQSATILNDATLNGSTDYLTLEGVRGGSSATVAWATILISGTYVDA